MTSASYSNGPIFGATAGVDGSLSSNAGSRTVGDATMPLPTMFSDMAYGPTFMKSLDELLASSAAMAASVSSSSTTFGRGGDVGIVGGGRSTTFTNGGSGNNSFTERNNDGSMLLSGAFGTGANSSAANFVAEASAYRLLAREGGGFDAASLGKATRELKYKLQKSAAASQGEQGEGRGQHVAGDRNRRMGSSDHPLNIDQFLQKDLEGTIFSNLREPREKAVRDSTNSMRGTMDEMFKRDTERFLERKGYRSFEGTATGAQRDLSTSFSSLPPFQQPALNIPNTFGSYSGGSLSVGGTGSIHAPLDEFPRRHAGLVCKLNASEEADSSSFSAGKFLSDLEHLSEEWVTSNLSSNGVGDKEAYIGYATSLNLLGSMLRAGENGSTTGMSPTPLSLSAGALKHLTSLYQNDISQTVSEAVRAGRITDQRNNGTFTSLSSTTAQDVSWYVQLKMMGSIGGGSSSFGVSGALLWPKIYSCLQCGNAVAALQITQHELMVTNNERQSAQVEPCVTDMLSHLAQFQSSARNNSDTANDFVWASVLSASSATGNNSMAIMDVPDNVQRELNELYRVTKEHCQKHPMNTVEKYKLSTLALLIQKDDEDISNLGVAEENIEDYLFTRLWMIVSRSVYGSSRRGGTGGSTPTISVKSLSELGATLKHWGPNYFEGGDAHRSDTVIAGGWAYSSPLMMCQQFSSALCHLATKGGPLGLLQATHLAIVLDSANIPIVDLDVRTEDDGRQTKGIDGRQLYASLLKSYSNCIKDSDPPAALEYLVRFPSSFAATDGNNDDSFDDNDNAKRIEIAKLILSTGAYDVLIGNVSATGNRELNLQDGLVISSAVMSGEHGRRNVTALDAHFSPSQISALLEETAEMALREGRIEDAAELLLRAGSFDRLLTLFNRQLGDLLLKLNGGKGGETARKRKFWNDAAVNFHTTFLTTGRITCDESRSRTFDLLLNLFVFVDRYESSQYNEAASIMDSLDLMPRSQGQITNYIDSHHRQLDPSVCGNMPGLIVLFMECLSYTFSSLKSQLIRQQESELTTSLQQKLYELRERAKALVTFAGLISSDTAQVNETSSRLAKLQASMM